MTSVAFVCGLLCGIAYASLLWREWAKNERDIQNIERRFDTAIAALKARLAEQEKLK